MEVEGEVAMEMEVKRLVLEAAEVLLLGELMEETAHSAVAVEEKEVRVVPEDLDMASSSSPGNGGT